MSDNSGLPRPPQSRKVGLISITAFLFGMVAATLLPEIYFHNERNEVAAAHRLICESLTAVSRLTEGNCLPLATHPSEYLSRYFPLPSSARSDVLHGMRGIPQSLPCVLSPSGERCYTEVNAPYITYRIGPTYIEFVFQESSLQRINFTD